MNIRFVRGSLVAMFLGWVPGAWAVHETVPMADETPSAVTEIDGSVVSVDLTNHRLKVKDAQGEVVVLQITQATAISSAGNSKLVLKDVSANDKIHAYYTTADKKARQIDVSPRLPIMRDLETR